MIHIESVTVNPKTLHLELGTWCYKLSASVTPANATCPCVKWESGNPGVAAVNENTGYVYANGVGTASIAARAQDGSGRSDICTVKVTQTVPVCAVVLSTSAVTIHEGVSKTLTATIQPDNASFRELIWRSDNTNVAEVTDGVVYAKSRGTATIYVSATDGSGATASCRVTVTGDILVESITISTAKETMNVGQSTYLSATVCPECAANKTIRWETSGLGNVTVTPSGLVTAHKAGTESVYAVARDGSDVRGCCLVTVKEKNTSTVFDITKKDCLKEEFLKLLGNKKIDIPAIDLWYVYTTSQCVDIVIDNDITITNLANRFDIPKTLIQTILLRELWCLNQFDAAGDGEVVNYFAWKEECEFWENQSKAYQMLYPYPKPPIRIKTDSSTGLGQIFAGVAIKAYNEAVDYGYILGNKIDGTNWKLCREVWNSLKYDDEYNIQMTTLNILSCMNELYYGFDLDSYTSGMYKRVFARYNSDINHIIDPNTNDVIDYGKECYEYFLIFNKYL